MIPFNKPAVTGNEVAYIQNAINSGKLCGDSNYGHRCQAWFEDKFSIKKALMTPSCTHALELAALLIDIQPGDEVITTSYTFVSTANAFALRGAKIIFVDIHPETMNINERLIESAITEKTKAIVPVHYAGVACDMDSIMALADKYQLYVIEDAAQAMMSSYKGRALGSIGHMAAFSFHETKNYTSGGEGGLLILNDESFILKAEILREKGTNRGQFFRGMVDKYSWVDIGSSYLPSEIQSAYLYAQLENADEILKKRLSIWNTYYNEFFSLQENGKIELPYIPAECLHNAHMFYIKLKNIEQRELMINYLRENNIYAVFHYIPLHSSLAGQQFSKFIGDDDFTTKESERLLRLPVFYNLEEEELSYIIDKVKAFFEV